MPKLAAHVRSDPKLKIACTICTGGDRRDCSSVNAVCGYTPGICRIDADGRLMDFIQRAKKRKMR